MAGCEFFRTSHYPYSEEEMRLADREGIVVIDEVPGVGLFTNFHVDVNLNNNKKNTWETLRTHENHHKVIQELIERDKNHACVLYGRSRMNQLVIKKVPEHILNRWLNWLKH